VSPPLACLLTAEFAKGNSLDRLGIRATFSLGIGVFVEEEFFRQLSQFFFLLVGQWFIAQGGTFPYRLFRRIIPNRTPPATVSSWY